MYGQLEFVPVLCSNETHLGIHARFVRHAFVIYENQIDWALLIIGMVRGPLASKTLLRVSPGSIELRRDNHTVLQIVLKSHRQRGIPRLQQRRERIVLVEN